MTTNTDIQEHATYNLEGKIVKTATIKGETAKQIKIESTSIQLYSGKDKVVNNTVLAINGVAWAAWNWSNGKYSDVTTYDKYPYLVAVGKDAVLTWTVKAADKSIAAKVKNLSYTYSYVAVDTPENPVDTGKKSLVEIECPTYQDAEALTEKIKAKDILSDDMTMFIAKSV